MPVKNEFYGLRAGVFYDPFGHKWHIHSPIEDVSFKEMQRRCDAMFSTNNIMAKTINGQGSSQEI
jgi:PhnB protein